MISKKQALKAANVNSLLSVSADAKTAKGEKAGYLTGILYLAPAETALKHLGRKGTLCPNAVNAGCAAACLYSAGRGRFNSGQQSRINKAVSFLTDKNAFMVALHCEIQSLITKAKNRDMTPAVRLNGTSDIDYTRILYSVGGEKPKTVFDHFPDLQFYDYTKNLHLLARDLPDNYHLTISYSESQKDYARSANLTTQTTGQGMAVVFAGELPGAFLGLPVIDGDQSDLRFLDRIVFKGIPYGRPYIVGLKAKGDAKKDNGGFVIRDY